MTERDSHTDPVQPAGNLPVYEPPAVTTFTDEQLLEALGPAQAAPYQIP